MSHKIIYQIVVLFVVFGWIHGENLSSEIEFDTNYTLQFYGGNHYVDKRASSIGDDGITYLNIGVLMASHLGTYKRKQIA